VQSSAESLLFAIDSKSDPSGALFSSSSRRELILTLGQLLIMYHFVDRTHKSPNMRSISARSGGRTGIGDADELLGEPFILESVLGKLPILSWLEPIPRMASAPRSSIILRTLENRYGEYL
jgi:hypothetical protein